MCKKSDWKENEKKKGWREKVRTRRRIDMKLRGSGGEGRTKLKRGGEGGINLKRWGEGRTKLRRKGEGRMKLRGRGGECRMNLGRRRNERKRRRRGIKAECWSIRGVYFWKCEIFSLTTVSSTLKIKVADRQVVRPALKVLKINHKINILESRD